MSTKTEFEAQAMSHLDALYRTALRMTGQAASAEDLVQETVLKAFRHFNRFKAGSNFRAWIFTILTNTHINQYRRNRRAPALTDFEQAEPAAAEEVVPLSSEDVEALGETVGDEAKAALGKLAPEFRIVFLLSTIEGLRYEEIARTQSIPMGTVMSRLFRARQFLRRELSSHARATGFLQASAPGRGAATATPSRST